jgi:DNA polymerase III epsilon subunit-like protein
VASDLQGKPSEVLVAVDVETSGPAPGRYSLLAIGACLVDDPRHSFYVELQPIGERVTPEAMAVHSLNLDQLKHDGLPPAEAMSRFEAWLQSEIPAQALPVFVGFNAAFDWMFVADYFDRFLGRNPFGHAALDIKAYFMGLTGGAWRDTTKSALTTRYPDHPHLTHNALQDALDQAALFRRIRDERPAMDQRASLRDSGDRNL